MEANAKKPLISRRSVVVGSAGIAACFVLGGVGKAFAANEDFLRPPGGQDYQRFLSACLRCDRCRSACERNAISVCTEADGLVNMRLPKLNFDFGYCDLCEGSFKCIEACPTGALRPFDSLTEKIGIAVIEKDECLTYRVSGQCDARCVGVCPVEALFLDDEGRLRIEEEACYGCGICEYVCPSNSYGTYSGTNLRGINIQPL